MPGPLALTLRAGMGPFRVGAPVPVGVEVRNTSGRAVWIVGVMDGSEAGFRHPRYEVRMSGPVPLQAPAAGECGNVAPLRLSDFRLLEPGEGFDPTLPPWLPLRAIQDFRPPAPGRYQLTLALDTDSPDEPAWLGLLGYPGEEAVLARLAQVPRLRVESDPLVIDVAHS